MNWSALKGFPPLRKTVSRSTRKKNMCVWDCQMATDMSIVLLILLPWRNVNMHILFWKYESRLDLLLVIRCTTYKKQKLIIHGSLEMWNFSSRGHSISHSFAVLSHEILSWTFKEKFYVPVCLAIILCIHMASLVSFWPFFHGVLVLKLS